MIESLAPNDWFPDGFPKLKERWDAVKQQLEEECPWALMKLMQSLIECT